MKNQYVQDPATELTELIEPSARQDQSTGNLSKITGDKALVKGGIGSAANSKTSLGLPAKGSTQKLIESRSKGSIKGQDKAIDKLKKLEIDSIEFEVFELFKKWTAEDKQHYGPVIQIEMDRTQNFMVIVFQNKYVHVYDI